MTVGERIRLVREQKGMSQDKLAKLLGYKDRSSISKIEKEIDENIYVDTVHKIANALNCSPLYLMGWEDKVENEKKSEDQVRLQSFIYYYEKLDENQKTIIDNLLKTFVSNQ